MNPSSIHISKSKKSHFYVKLSYTSFQLKRDIVCTNKGKSEMFRSCSKISSTKTIFSLQRLHQNEHNICITHTRIPKHKLATVSSLAYSPVGEFTYIWSGMSNWVRIFFGNLLMRHFIVIQYTYTLKWTGAFHGCLMIYKHYTFPIYFQHCILKISNLQNGDWSAGFDSTKSPPLVNWARPKTNDYNWVLSELTRIEPVRGRLCQRYWWWYVDITRFGEGWLIGWLVVFNVPSTARSFRDGATIYCPLRRTWSLVFTPSHRESKPRLLRGSPLHNSCATPAPLSM